MARSNDFNGPLFQKMLEDLQFADMAKRTQNGYQREVRKLAEYWKTSPDHLSEDQGRRYFLHVNSRPQMRRIRWHILMVGGQRRW